MKKIILGLFLLCSVNFISAQELKFKFSDKKPGEIVITAVEVIPSKVKEKLVSVKNIHGSSVTRKIKVDEKKYTKEEVKLVRSYAQNVKEKLAKLLAKVAPKLKASGELRLQVRPNGKYDLLFVGLSHPKVQSAIENKMYELKEFPALPGNLNIEEIQLRISLSQSVK